MKRGAVTGLTICLGPLTAQAIPEVLDYLGASYRQLSCIWVFREGTNGSNDS